MRDRSIDLGKGMVVLAMVYCHVLDFYGDRSLYPVVNDVILSIGALAFPSFLFFFGRTVRLAYLQKTYKTALPRMLKTFFRMLMAFYVSGIFYRLLVQGVPFEADAIRQVLRLQAIPGMSEFLVAFALYMLLVIVAFGPLKWMCKKPVVAIAPVLLSLACCFVPYEDVTIPQVALLIGGTDQCYFPIVQYMPYFLVGIVFEDLSVRSRRSVGIIAVGLSAAAFFSANGWPSRFPPAWNWICLSAIGVTAVQLIAWALLNVRVQYVTDVVQWICKRIESVGAASLTYLLYSNLILFALRGRHAVPKTEIFQRHWFWSKPIQSPLGSFYWTCILVALIAFLIYIAGRGKRPAK